MPQENPTPRLLNYQELILTLRGVCKEKRSGVMAITSESGGIAKITLEQGEIFDVSFRGVGGKTAFLLIKKIKQAQASFLKAPPGNAVKQLELSTTEILNLLDDNPAQQQSAPTANTAAEPKSVAASVAPLSQFALDDETVIIEAHLMVLIGPIARLIYQSYKKDIQRADSLEVLNGLLDKLAKQSLNPEQQKRFKQNLRLFIDQYGLKTPKAILDAFKSDDREIRLNLKTVVLFLQKYATQGELGSGLLTRLASQIEASGNLAGHIEILDILKFLEKTTKTGYLEIQEKNKKGLFYFQDGKLINAKDDWYSGITAAVQILQWHPDVVVFKTLTSAGVSQEIRQTVAELAKEIESSQSGILSKKEAEAYVHHPEKPAIATSESIHDALAREIDRRQKKQASQEPVKTNEVEYLERINQASYLAQSGDNQAAEQTLCEVLMNFDNHYNGWLWLARVLNHITGVEFALKKAAFLNPKNSEIIEEVKKFTTARKNINREFVLRCPFCWMPIAENEKECPHCQASFFMDPNFFNKVGKAKADILDKAIERYNQALLQNPSNAQNIYLHFYLGMAYLNRKYFHESLAQFNEIPQLTPDNLILLHQGKMLAKYMQTVGLVSDANAGQVVSETPVQQKRILVVEDSLVTRKVIAKTLASLGYEVFEAKDASEALADIENKQFDLVLLDIILPGDKDGYQILSEIRNKPVLAKIPVIMLTSRDSLFDKIKGRVSDADEYLTKPFQPDELLTTVKKYLG